MRTHTVTSRESRDMLLFDRLREKKLFPSNSELAEFAGNILPGIKGNRFDKMSRGDIAARVIEYLETKDPRTREALEASMRDAMKPHRKRPIETKEKANLIFQTGLYLCRQRPTLPLTFASSTIGPAGLNFRVRDGNGWSPRGKITDKSEQLLAISSWLLADSSGTNCIA